MFVDELSLPQFSQVDRSSLRYVSIILPSDHTTKGFQFRYDGWLRYAGRAFGTCDDKISRR
jgi:hypothetical protein